MEPNKNLSDQINNNIHQSEVNGGLFLTDVAIGETVSAKTRNTLYTINKTGENDYLISGSKKYCPQPTDCKIAGSTWGGSMLKIGFIGIGMHLEMYLGQKGILTSMIESVNKI